VQITVNSVQSYLVDVRIEGEMLSRGFLRRMLRDGSGQIVADDRREFIEFAVGSPRLATVRFSSSIFSDTPIA